MMARGFVLAREPMRRPGAAMGDVSFRRVGLRLHVGEEIGRVRPHRRKLAARIAAGPQAVVGRQLTGRVLFA